MSTHVRRLCAAGVLAVTCATMLTACGTSGNPPKASASAGVRFAECIRAHGVTDFPDPGGSFPPGLKQSPAFRSAMQTCLKLEPPGTSTGKRFTEVQRIAALRQVRCLRNHGMPNFPDPTFPASGGELFPTIPGFNPESPAFKRAAAACGLQRTVGQPHGG